MKWETFCTASFRSKALTEYKSRKENDYEKE